MKHCVNCEFMKKETVQDRTGQMYLQMMCSHFECTDPVTAEALPCNVARKDPVFCGLEGKRYRKAEPVTIEDPPKSNLIMMDKT